MAHLGEEFRFRPVRRFRAVERGAQPLLRLVALGDVGDRAERDALAVPGHHAGRPLDPDGAAVAHDAFEFVDIRHGLAFDPRARVAEHALVLVRGDQVAVVAQLQDVFPIVVAKGAREGIVDEQELGIAADADTDFGVLDEIAEILLADAKRSLGPLLLRNVGEGGDIAAVRETGAAYVENPAIRLEPLLAFRAVGRGEHGEAPLDLGVRVVLTEAPHTGEMGQHVAQREAALGRIGRIVVQVEESPVAGDDPQVLVEYGESLIDRAERGLEQQRVVGELLLNLSELRRVDRDRPQGRDPPAAVLYRELRGEDGTLPPVRRDDLVLERDGRAGLQDLVVAGEADDGGGFRQRVLETPAENLLRLETVHLLICLVHGFVAPLRVLHDHRHRRMLEECLEDLAHVAVGVPQLGLAPLYVRDIGADGEHAAVARAVVAGADTRAIRKLEKEGLAIDALQKIAPFAYPILRVADCLGDDARQCRFTHDLVERVSGR